jgi:hypothetical protein
MDESTLSCALVVGIDRYDLETVTPLSGASSDAIKAVEWLRSIGVPWEMIYLHLSPTESSREAANNLSLKFSDAKFETIWSSIKTIKDRFDGATCDRLFIILSGHGLYEPSTGRIFCTQDYGVNDNVDNNIGIDDFVKYFLQLNFPNQFLIFDGCQNIVDIYDVENVPIARSPPVGRQANPMRVRNAAEHGLVACFAASVGEEAIEIDERGAMMRRFLESIDFDSLSVMKASDIRQNAIIYDWDSGSRSVDLLEMYGTIIAPAVTKDAAAQVPPHQQNPYYHLFGTAGRRNQIPIFRLPSEKTSALSLNVGLRDVLKFIEQVRICVVLPFRQKVWPNPASMPVHCRVPVSVEIVPSCVLNDQSPWMCRGLESRLSFEGAEDVFNFEFELKKARATPNEDRFFVGIVDKSTKAIVSVGSLLSKGRFDRPEVPISRRNIPSLFSEADIRAYIDSYPAETIPDDEIEEEVSHWYRLLAVKRTEEIDKRKSLVMSHGEESLRRGALYIALVSIPALIFSFPVAVAFAMGGACLSIYCEIRRRRVVEADNKVMIPVQLAQERLVNLDGVLTARNRSNRITTSVEKNLTLL